MPFTERAGLCTVLLLTGCASPVVVTGPPSGSVVDSILSRSAADISAMQYRVHQSGPSAKRPTPLGSVKPVALLASSHDKAVVGRKTAGGVAGVNVAGAGPADGFIRQGGSAPTLRAALRNVIPPGYSISFDKRVAADTPELWSWKGNDRWPFVVDKLLTARGMKAIVNEKNKTVSIEPAQHAQVSRTSVTAVLPAGIPQKVPQATTIKVVQQPGAGRNPFHGDSGTATAPPAVLHSPVRGQHVPVQPALPKVVQVRHWRIEAGNTVKDWLYSQAVAETCNVPGIKNWTIAWITPTNYRIDAPLAFEGSFREMLNQLFTLYGAAKVPLYAGVRAAQCVVSVDDKEVQ